MKIAKAVLKGLWVLGFLPRPQDYSNIFDSFVHIDDQAAIDQQIVNTAISNYDNLQKQQSANGAVDTVGDVFKITQGYSDTRNLNAELKWSGLPGKPVSINLSWTTQTVVTDFTTYNPLASGGSSAPKWLLSDIGGLTGSFLIVDIKTERHWIATGGETGFFVDQIVAVKYGITPKTTL